jgi:hypothetical protein
MSQDPHKGTREPLDMRRECGQAHAWASAYRDHIPQVDVDLVRSSTASKDSASDLKTYLAFNRLRQPHL